MKELHEIVKAFEDADKRGLSTALATVVHVVGSAYRHEGARMLITENGELTGAISGGCLEGDALRKARLAMAENRKMLVTYDTSDDDDAKFGVGLGCNGIIQVLLEPIDPKQELNPIKLFKTFLGKRQNAVLGTFFSLDNKSGPQPGTSILITDTGEVEGTFPFNSLKEFFINDALTTLKSTRSVIKHYTGPTDIKGFVEFLKPPIHLVVFGAGNDAIPLVQFANILGWEISVIDGRPNYAIPSRFPSAKKVQVTRAEKAFDTIHVDDWTVAVLMTHNYNYDLEVLRKAILLNLKYIGTLGPKKKLRRMLDELTEEEFEIPEDSLSRVFGPTGLDIGSETPEEIALSIIAEIKAVTSNREGTSLKYKTEDHDVKTVSLQKHIHSKFHSCKIDL
ncbi:XdhC/CoxI family protein [Pedobacter sp. P351]|uniref:XdhC family protein n=1 Tax=Pedobacter superstes TaxID=3133441 RepID=UPI0030975182